MSIKAAGALILLAVVFALGWYSGALAGRLGKANAAQKQTSEQLAQVLKAQDEDRKRAEKLQKTLDALPKSEGKIREVVRQSPSKCERPAAVSERVREAVREANAARKVPGDF